MGPISLRICDVHGWFRVTLTFIVCSVAPGNFFKVQRTFLSCETNSALDAPVPGLVTRVHDAAAVHLGRGNSTDTLAPKWLSGISARTRTDISIVFEAVSSIEGKIRKGVRNSPVKR